MPTVQPGSKVLVSGANGFIAIWVVRTLLEKGYAVRGTVRSQGKGKHLKDVFKNYGDKFELAIVEDITKEGAFDEAVKGVDAIEHTASPCFLDDVDDPQVLIGPAVKGTVGILQSALKNALTVKRIVVTGSTASVLHVDPNPLRLSEVDWNEKAVKEVEELGRAVPNMTKYQASKTLAEKAAWEFHSNHKSSVNWDLVVIHPPYVFGPVLHEVSSVNSLNTSIKEWAAVVLDPNSGGKSTEGLATQSSSWIDVRDLAEAHSRALEREEAGGERIIVTAGPFVWQDWIDVANSLEPSPIPSHKLPLGNPGGGKDAIYRIQYDAAKAQRIFGLKYRTKEETAKDILADFEARGW